MDLSPMSLIELESALLSPVASDARRLRVAEAGVPALPTAAPSDPLTYKLCVARELLLRGLRARMHAGPIFDAPHVVREWLRLYCANLEHEVFVVLYLTPQHALIEAVQHFSGTLTQTCVYPREVVKGALARNAAVVVLCHNHPSGQAEPSRADKFLTQALKSALDLVDVRVLDHFVVAGDNVMSFAERGLI